MVIFLTFCLALRHTTELAQRHLHPVRDALETISCMVSPVVQSFRRHSAPASSSTGASLNTSARHLGVGLGAAIGGLAVALTDVGWPLDRSWPDGTGITL